MIETSFSPLYKLTEYSLILWKDSASDLWPVPEGLHLCPLFFFFSFAATTENFLPTHITVCNVFIYSCKISPQDVPLFHSLQPTCLFSAAESGDCKTTKHSRAKRRKRSKVCLHERSSVCTDMSTILFFCTLDLLGFSWTSTKRHKKKWQHSLSSRTQPQIVTFNPNLYSKPQELKCFYFTQTLKTWAH